MGAHLTSFPLRCFANPRGASTAAATRLPRTFIACTESAGQKVIGPQAGARARRENWPVHELATGDYPMVSELQATADLVHDLATSG